MVLIPSSPEKFAEWQQQQRRDIWSRQRSDHFDPAFDLTRVLLANPYPSFSISDGTDCADLIIFDGNSLETISLTHSPLVGERQDDVYSAAYVERAARAGQVRAACNNEIRQTLAIRLRSRFTANQLRQSWRRLVPFSYGTIPPDGAEHLSNIVLTRFENDRLELFIRPPPDAIIPGGRAGRVYAERSHIRVDSRQRAWNYLHDTRSGAALFAEVEAFVRDVVIPNKATPHILCPTALRDGIWEEAQRSTEPS